ncbi:hypothetical protein Moror_9387 [Moniliophthora roreri MCA 2997]|uniref:F-box domain-containing protein n=1 Tax=Moniliophthora roreri (strain MCA 2997) TaxID=1381753 RepID=V2WZU1_MONRO|nr:hypothetical protein Moror_9387 [Moniliophthora roreri MCA 2997]
MGTSTTCAPQQQDNPPRKKLKMDIKQKKSRNKSEDQSTVCFFLKLPVELLAEVLLYTKSPRDVLSVARCCKELCYTLLNPKNQYIWKYARENFHPEPPPEPPKQFTESAYAAFVFDGGTCEICGERAPAMWGSYALRLKICRRPECRKAMTSPGKAIMIEPPLSTLETQRPFIPILPRLEADACFETSKIPVYQSQLWPANSARYRTSDWTDALQQYLQASSNPQEFELYVQRCAKRVEAHNKFMKSCVELFKWRGRHINSSKINEQANELSTRNLATRIGVPYYDLINTPTYGPIYRQKNKIIDRIHYIDYDIRKDAIEAELLKVKEQRARRTHEETYRKARELVEKHYDRLRATKEEAPLPSLQTFRQLPIIAQLQKNCGPTLDLEKELRSEVVKSLLHNQLEEWRNKAKEHMAGVIGVPKNWKSANANKLHPVERITARFRCSRCGDRVGIKYANDMCLPFAGVCAHQCSLPPGSKKGSLPPWNVEKFVKDETAMNAMTKLVAICNIDAEDKSSVDALKAIGYRVQCDSCASRIIMNPENVIGHAHRHGVMQMTLLSNDEALRVLGSHPTLTKLAQRLVGSEKSALSARQLKAYGCRHCTQSKDGVDGSSALESGGSDTANAASTAEDATGSASPASAAAPDGTSTSNSSSAPTANEGSEPKSNPLFTFDGLRSHLKSKHGVLNVRDEDFYCREADEALRLLNGGKPKIR